MTSDSDAVRDLYPALRRSVEGMLKYRVDKNYAVTAASVDAQTSALGHSPPAVQGDKSAAHDLWLMQLAAAAGLARNAGDIPSAERWQKISQKSSRSSGK